MCLLHSFVTLSLCCRVKNTAEFCYLKPLLSSWECCWILLNIGGGIGFEQTTFCVSVCVCVNVCVCVFQKPENQRRLLKENLKAICGLLGPSESLLIVFH